jgi:undecaprenyl diphosphate synthase
MGIQNEIKHIAFIMDGNGRWAQKKGMPRECGYSFGFEKFKEIATYCYELGIPNATFYAFSTENWKRPVQEVNAIMNLVMAYLDEAKNSLDKDIGMIFLGSKTPFSDEMREKMEAWEKDSAGKAKKLCIAVNYGGRAEISMR